MHFNDGIVEFGFDCKARKLSDKSISNYQKQLRYLLRYLEAEFQVNQVEEVRSFHIKQFLVDMADKGRKPQYINDLLKVFKTFFNYMKKEGYIKERPTASIHNMKQPKVKIITFSEDEIRKMLHYYQGRNFLNIRNRTMIALFFDTGMRLTEVMTLQPEQIREDSIIVHGKGNKERLVPVSASLAKALMQYQMVREAYFEAKLPERYLFVSKNGRKLTQEAITKVLKKAAADVGVNCNVRVSPHTCRHFYAQQHIKMGTDLYTISRLLGHENIQITQTYLNSLRDKEVISISKQKSVLLSL